MRVRSVADLPVSMRDQAQRLLGLAGPKASPALKRERKYGNKRITVDDMTFDSKLEWRCFEWLSLRKTEGEVLWFVRQVPFELEGGVVYRADFLVVLAAGGVDVLDAKGKDTQASRNKRKQVRARYGVFVKLWPPR